MCSKVENELYRLRAGGEEKRLVEKIVLTMYIPYLPAVQANAVECLEIGHDCFLPHPFHSPVIIAISSYQFYITQQLINTVK
jgi:hypothetical protein